MLLNTIKEYIYKLVENRSQNKVELWKLAYDQAISQ